MVIIKYILDDIPLITQLAANTVHDFVELPIWYLRKTNIHSLNK